MKDGWRELMQVMTLMVFVFALAFSLVLLCFCVSSCTFSLNVVHTQGKASDTIDETQSPKNSAEASIPSDAISNFCF